MADMRDCGRVNCSPAIPAQRSNKLSYRDRLWSLNHKFMCFKPEVNKLYDVRNCHVLIDVALRLRLQKLPVCQYGSASLNQFANSQRTEK
jgi:hypothetical protein